MVVGGPSPHTHTLNFLVARASPSPQASPLEVYEGFALQTPLRHLPLPPANDTTPPHCGVLRDSLKGIRDWLMWPIHIRLERDMGAQWTHMTTYVGGGPPAEVWLCSRFWFPTQSRGNLKCFSGMWNVLVGWGHARSDRLERAGQKFCNCSNWNRRPRDVDREHIHICIYICIHICIYIYIYIYIYMI